MRILSLLHPGGGHSGLLRDAARDAGHELVEWTPGAGEPMPGALGEHDAIAVFGGGMNVTDQERLPWLTGEIELLRDALARPMPMLGVCLGAQLVAAAAGGEVHRVEPPEIGWLEVERLAAGAADPVAAALPERFTAFQWHSYACRPPAGAVELAGSPVCSQAFVLGGHAWGVQFHPEVTPDVLHEWIDDYDSDPDAVRLGFDPDAARAEVPERIGPWNAIGRRLFDAWLAAAAARVTAPA
jgi:GMP synthase-like glutamine amidotransferase